MSLKTAMREVGTVSVLDLSGKITIGEGDAILREHVHNPLDGGHSKILLNLEAVSYMDSAWIGELVACIASGLGAAAPVQAVALPLLSQATLLGVVEVATFRAFNSQEQALLEELLPVMAMSLEVLQHNLRTQELLGQTQEQARQLEKQTEELTQSQEELLAQKEELLTQQRELTTQREQLKVSEERSRLILESSAEGIFGTDNEGQVTFVNPAAWRMLGFTAEELIAQPSHAAFHHHRPDGSEYLQKPSTIIETASSAPMPREWQ